MQPSLDNLREATGRNHLYNLYHGRAVLVFLAWSLAKRVTLNFVIIFEIVGVAKQFRFIEQS